MQVPVSLGGNSGKRRLHWWTLVLGSEWVEPQTGHPSLESYVQETRLLGCLENFWDRQKGWRSLDTTLEEGAGAGLPPGRAERGPSSQLPLHCTPQFELREQSHSLHGTNCTGSRVARTWEKTRYRDRGDPGAQGIAKWGQWQPLLVLTQAMPQKKPRLLKAFQPPEFS